MTNMLINMWDSTKCFFKRCPHEQEQEHEETFSRLDEIPDQLDRIIKKRIRNNVMERAYIEELRRKGGANG